METEEEVAVIASNEKLQRLSRYLNKPIALLKNAGKHGIKGIKNLFYTLFLFGIINLFIIIYAVVAFFNSGLKEGFLSMLITFIAGILFTGLAVYLAYKNIITGVMRVIYQEASPLVEKICTVIVNSLAKAKTATDDKNTTMLVAGKAINTITSKLPGAVKNTIHYFFKKAPVSKYATEVNTLIANNETEKASEIVYSKTDAFIMDTLLAQTTSRWIYALLLLNIIIQALIIRAAW